MKVYIAGVSHFDPLCRGRLRQWLQFLSESNRSVSSPSFLATEWDSSLFAQVKKQRPAFAKQIQNEWKGIRPDVLKTLELSLGYEADSHLDVFPDVEMLWLDEGRDYDDIADYAEQRLHIYKRFLGGSSLQKDCGNVLALLGDAAERGSQGSTNGDERDQKFASLILQRLVDDGDKWAIAVVGANHANDYPQTMRRLFTIA